MNFAVKSLRTSKVYKLNLDHYMVWKAHKTDSAYFPELLTERADSFKPKVFLKTLDVSPKLPLVFFREEGAR